VSVELNAEIGNYAFDIAQRYLAGKRHFSKLVLIPSDLHNSRCHQHAGTTGQLTPQAGAVLAAASNSGGHANCRPAPSPSRMLLVATGGSTAVIASVTMRIVYPSGSALVAASALRKGSIDPWG
jgi:hypothetical protein